MRTRCSKVILSQPELHETLSQTAKEKVIWGLERWQKTGVWFSGPTSGDSPLPITTAQGGLAPSGLHGHLHACGIYPYRHIHICIHFPYRISLQGLERLLSG